MGKYFKLPATDLAGVLGFAAMVIVVLAVAKRTPVVKNLI